MRFLTYILFFSTALLFFSCKDKLSGNPPVAPEKMTDILTDIHLADAYSQGLATGNSNAYTKNKDSLAVFYNSILKHHNLTFDELNNTLEWYHHHPKILDSIYLLVLQKVEHYQFDDSARKSRQ